MTDTTQRIPVLTVESGVGAQDGPMPVVGCTDSANPEPMVVPPGNFCGAHNHVPGIRTARRASGSIPKPKVVSMFAGGLANETWPRG